jgi:hypothetical protein
MKKLCIKKIEKRISLRDLFAQAPCMILKTQRIMKESIELPQSISQVLMKAENSKMKVCILEKEVSTITIE